MKEKTIKGFDESKEYTEIGIKHVMGVLFWDYNEEELNRIVPDNGLRKRKRYPGSALLPMAIKWNAIKKSDIQLNGELLGQGEVKVSTKEFVEYILKKIEDMWISIAYFVIYQLPLDMISK